jgi:hypothetical protein
MFEDVSSCQYNKDVSCTNRVDRILKPFLYAVLEIDFVLLAGSILTSAGPAWDLRVQLMEHEGED